MTTTEIFKEMLHMAWNQPRRVLWESIWIALAEKLPFEALFIACLFVAKTLWWLVIFDDDHDSR